MLSHELPVYRTAYELSLQVFHLVGQYRKEYKYTIGERLQTRMLDLLMGIYHSNRVLGEDRVRKLTTITGYIEEIRMLLRLSHDLNIITLLLFAKTSESLESIGKQTLAWSRSVQGVRRI